MMASGGILSLQEINALPTENFIWLFNNVIEHCPEAASEVSKHRPFTKIQDLKNAFCQYLDYLNQTEKTNILVKHPDLGGKLNEEKLTSESQAEQNEAGISSINKAEKQILVNCNAMYREKFSFPFVICARENKFLSILAAMEARLKNEQSEEISIGIEEVKKICKLRIGDLVWPEP